MNKTCCFRPTDWKISNISVTKYQLDQPEGIFKEISGDWKPANKPIYINDGNVLVSSEIVSLIKMKLKLKLLMSRFIPWFISNYGY